MPSVQKICWLVFVALQSYQIVEEVIMIHRDSPLNLFVVFVVASSLIELSLYIRI
jgi:hypothetical protein